MTPIRTRLGAAAVAAALLLAGACSDDDDPAATSDTTEAGDDQSTTAADGASDPDDGDTPASTEEDETDTGDTGDEATGATVAVADSDLGSILVDAQGITLYLFTNDTPGEPSTCAGDCAAAWPALTGPVTAGDGVDDSLIGTVTNEDGSEQATYNGWPLYYYASDSGPGDTTGQGVGGVWWVIDAEGNAIET